VESSILEYIEFEEEEVVISQDELEKDYPPVAISFG
jgi:hypothetical protein